MIGYTDKVHIVGMSASGSEHLSVTEFEGATIEPPIEVVFEGDTQVTVTRDALAARYEFDELRTIGEGDVTLGLNRVIGTIVTGESFKLDEIKPLHPSIIVGVALGRAELTA